MKEEELTKEEGMSAFHDWKNRYEAIVDEGGSAKYLTFNEDGAHEIESPLDRNERIERRASNEAAEVLAASKAEADGWAAYRVRKQASK